MAAGVARVGHQPERTGARAGRRVAFSRQHARRLSPGARDAEPIAGLLWPAKRQLLDRDTPNIFIVEKGREHNVILRLRMALWDFCVFSAAFLAASLWLVHSAWPWL